MKKVGIITIMDNINYGNRLQNYAMEKFLESCSFEVYTIPHIGFKDWYYVRKDKAQYLRQLLYKIKPLVWIVHKLKGKRLETQKEIECSDREVKFKEFNKVRLHLSEFIIDKEPITRALARGYDYFVTGSDQVWNPLYNNAKYVMYLRFAPKRKRIAVAASFGMSDIPDEHKKIVARYLRGMRYISVREDSGREIVEKYTGKTCDIIMDPTLLVPISVWKEFVKDISLKLPERYIVVYFLGDISSRRKEYIERLAERNICKIIWLNVKEHPEYYSVDPSEFVYILKCAQFIVTDSFHGCVFSILFHKQFCVYRRDGYKYDMFDRICTLLKMTNLTSHIQEDSFNVIEDISEEQYVKIDTIISVKRKQAINKLLKVMV